MTRRQQLWFWLTAFAVVVAALYLWRDILLPFIAGMAVAYFLDPAADRLEKWGCSRAVATSIITGAFVVVVVAVLLLILPVLHSQIVQFAERVPTYAEMVRESIDPLLGTLRARVSPEVVERLRDVASGFVGGAIGWISRVLGSIWGGGMALFHLLSLIVITPVVAFYLLRDWDRMIAKIDSWLPKAHAQVIREQATLVDRTLAGFVRGQALVCLILGAYYGIALTLIGLDFGLIIGLGAGLISFIPFVGSIIGFAVSLGLALLQFSEWLPVALVAAVFIVGQIAEGYFLTPKLVGDRVGLHPVWIIFALLAGGVLLGFVGVLLAIPVAAVVGVLARFGLDRYLASRLYQRRPGASGTDETGQIG